MGFTNIQMQEEHVNVCDDGDLDGRNNEQTCGVDDVMSEMMMMMMIR